MRLTLLLLGVAGCVWAQPLPAPVIEDMCEACLDSEACDQDGQCDTRCSDYESEFGFYARCVDPARVCILGDCVIPCEDEDCPGGLVCRDSDILNQCLTSCYDDSDCRSNFRCCEPFQGEDCDVYTCIRR